MAYGGETVASGKVAQLVSQLNAPTRAEREAAEQALLERGLEVLSALPETAPDPATRAALTRIRAQLSRNLTIGSVRQPSRVSLSGNGTLEEVAAAWLDDLGTVRIALSEQQRSRPVSLEIHDRPYWEAIDTLAAAAELWPDVWDAQGRLTFRERRSADDDVQLSYSGSFRIAAGPIRKSALAGTKSTFLYRLPVEIRAEPGVRPLFIEYEADSGLLLNGKKKKKLSPYTPSASYELPVGQAGGTAQLRLTFTGPDISGPLTYQAEFVATIAAGQAKFVYHISRDPFRPVQKQKGSVSTRLREVEWKNDEVKVELAVVYEEGGLAFESYRTWVYHNDAVLIVERDEKRSPVIPHEPAYEILAHSPGAILLRYTYKNVPDDVAQLAFAYHAPTEIVEVPLKVELKGLSVK